ncbi:MerR family transcriptional regulator [Pseudenhygromyxa sp. WMMC2535]|uniref:MerR family transcriptional regulator n=1 Tax=Pseudenhygromyxa sp. WMMC2535 TaxID=2712867 RepID=UPI001C3E7248|nr:MerR family transcriptional regulator [Pseudenhygromyxa sp. WMMC2535]
MGASKKKVARKRGARKAGAAKPAADGDELDLGTDKLYFKIGEVAEIVGVAAHVLRYWEGEFAIIKPQKSRSQQRVYRRKDVENLLRIKHLLYERKFTLAGARQELRGGSAKIEPAAVNGIYKARQSLGRVREQLDLLAVAVRSEAMEHADPSTFVREVGGAEALLADQTLLARPDRERG